MGETLDLNILGIFVNKLMTQILNACLFSEIWNGINKHVLITFLFG